MNSTSKMLLNDYLTHTNSVRLNLFVQSVSPTIKLDKRNTPLLTTLIEDYKSDQNSKRLKAIDKFLLGIQIGIQSLSAAYSTASLTAARNTLNKDNKDNKLDAILNGPPNPNILRRKELSDEMTMLRTRDLSNINILNKYNELKDELFKVESEMGLFNDNYEFAQRDTELALVKGILGDWTKQGTSGYEILHGSMPKFNVKSVHNITYLINLLEKYSNQKARQFFVTSNVGSGFGDGKHNQFTLVDKQSGMAAEPSIKMTNENGKDMTSNISMLGMG